MAMNVEKKVKYVSLIQSALLLNTFLHRPFTLTGTKVEFAWFKICVFIILKLTQVIVNFGNSWEFLLGRLNMKTNKDSSSDSYKTSKLIYFCVEQSNDGTPPNKEKI